MNKIWKDIAKHLRLNQPVMLLYVLSNEGSSPGKQGFKMSIAEDGAMYGSIGGGMMEQKLVELAKSYLKDSSNFSPFLKRQIHSKSAEKDQSGMICSGEQTVAFYKLDQSHLEEIEAIANNNNSGYVLLTETGVSFSTSPSESNSTVEENRWAVSESLRNKHIAHIMGGGHVGLALSRVLKPLDFYVHIYDDRDQLYTLEQNEWADEKHVVDYHNVRQLIHKEGDNYIAIVSFGYRTDKVILEGLIDRYYAYIGMMGSNEKIRKIREELTSEGVAQKSWDKVFSPIGVLEHCGTPEEIAISIAAQMIEVKNAKNIGL